MSKKYQRSFQVEIEVWVSTRDEVFGGVSPTNPEHYGEFRACVRHSNGEMAWQWCETFEQAVAWCERFNPKKEIDKAPSPI